MVRLVFFGHDAHDPAVQRRIAAFGRVGADVLAFTMRRGPAFETPWRNIDLGETRDAAFAQRVGALARATPVVLRERAALQQADVFYARNLDMLALALRVKQQSGARAKVIYECLDIHRFMTRRDPLGAVMRAVERGLLKASDLLVISSPAFEREYFARTHPGQYRALLIENRLPPGFDYGPRPVEARAPGLRLRIGWFGNLRCRRSLSLLLALADRFPDRVDISMRGAPAKAEFADFDAQLAGRSHVQFGGRYAWPADLAHIYGDVDLVWAGDFHDPGANSKWLLPNRLYEGGYYAVPPLAPADSETGRWIAAHGFGFTLPEPLEQTLPAFVQTLDLQRLAEARARLIAEPVATFLQPEHELQRVLDAALGARA